MKDELHRRIIQVLTRRPTQFAELVKWVRALPRGPIPEGATEAPVVMPSRLALQQKIEELLKEKL